VRNSLLASLYFPLINGWAVIGQCWLTAVLVALVASARGQETKLFPDVLAREVHAAVGKRTTVLPDGTDGMHYFPDGPLSILSARPLRFLMPMGNRTVLVSGRDFGSLTSQREVLGPSGSGPDASYAGIYAAWRPGNAGPFVAIYHGENHEGMGRMEGNDINGAVWSVGLATIDPVNERIERRGEILRADKPRQPIAGKPHEIAALRVQGVGEPSMTPDRDGKFLLCYYTETSNRLKRSVCLGVARSPIEARGEPGSWKKFHDGRWEEPGLGGHETPVLSAEGGDVGQSFVTYIKEWDRYLLVFCHMGFEDFQRGEAKQSGVYVATSRDGLKWTEPQRIMAVMTVFKNGRPCVQHPTLVVTRATKNRLEGRLFHAFTPRWPTPHHLAACPITIQLKEQ
jgi:hypothetical protein